MNFFVFHPPGKNSEDKSNKHMLVPLHEPQQNTNEGSEFLDDAIRVEEQPIIHAEENISTGCPYEQS